MMRADTIGPQINDLLRSLIQYFIDMHKIQSNFHATNYILTNEFLKIIVCSVKLIKILAFLESINSWKYIYNVLFQEIGLYKKNWDWEQTSFLPAWNAISAFTAVWLLQAGISVVVKKHIKDSENPPTQEHQSIGSIIILKKILLNLAKN